MTDKLTLQDCFKYPNAKIIKYDILNSGRTVIYDNIIRLIENYESGYHIIVHNCKLILREITDLTDEEIKKCLDIALWSEDGVPMDKRSITINEKNKKHWDCSLSKTQRDLADYLKEINVDIYGFFECGKAEKE